MSRTFVLKARDEDSQGVPRWQDYVALQNALEVMVKNKALTRVAVEMGVARKVELARLEHGGQVNADLEIELEEGEVERLRDGLWKLPPEAYGRDMMTGQMRVPRLATLGEMLEDWEEQLG
jgi:hypothetical protein